MAILVKKCYRDSVFINLKECDDRFSLCRSMIHITGKYEVVIVWVRDST